MRYIRTNENYSHIWDYLSNSKLSLVSFCSRKNFKILLSVGIILTVVVSISYFHPMRMIYPILPG